VSGYRQMGGRMKDSVGLFSVIVNRVNDWNIPWQRYLLSRETMMYASVSAILGGQTHCSLHPFPFLATTDPPLHQMGLYQKRYLPLTSTTCLLHPIFYLRPRFGVHTPVHVELMPHVYIVLDIPVESPEARVELNTVQGGRSTCIKL